MPGLPGARSDAFSRAPAVEARLRAAKARCRMAPNYHTNWDGENAVAG